MRKMQVALAASLLALTMPAFAQAQIVQGADGHYYKLVPLRHAKRFAAARAEVPASVQAQVPNTWGCHLTHFLDNEYEPEYTTVCGLNDTDPAMLAQ